MVAYHDDDWGRPVADDALLFEMLCLEGAQAGLSWSTILRKRANYRRAFAGFDPHTVARFTQVDEERLLADTGIVRNRAKIKATIGNARAALRLMDEFGSLHAYFASWVAQPPNLAQRRRARHDPRNDAGQRRAVKGSAEARLQVCRPDHRLLIHAVGGPRR